MVGFIIPGHKALFLKGFGWTWGSALRFLMIQTQSLAIFSSPPHRVFWGRGALWYSRWWVFQNGFFVYPESWKVEMLQFWSCANFFMIGWQKPIPTIANYKLKKLSAEKHIHYGLLATLRRTSQGNSGCFWYNLGSTPRKPRMQSFVTTRIYYIFSREAHT